MTRMRKTALVLSAVALLGSGITAYARGSGGFPYERFGDDAAGNPGLSQMTPHEVAAGGGAAGGAPRAGSGGGSGAGPGGAGLGNGSGMSGSSGSSGSGSSGMGGAGGNSPGQ
jgi:hypothetical protein